MLTETEKTQNERALKQILQRFPNFKNFPEKQFLDWCAQKDIWLTGLSGVVLNRFVETLAQLSEQNASPEVTLKTIETKLAAELAAENAYLRKQYAKQQNTSQLVSQLTIVPNEKEWLEASHVINATAPLAQHPNIFVAQPIVKIDEDEMGEDVDKINADKIVEAAFKSDPQKQLGFVFENKGGGHWFLYIHEKTADGTIAITPYNPKGDGQCGDHAIVRAYQVARKHGFTTSADDLLVQHQHQNKNHRKFTQTVIERQPVSAVTASTEKPAHHNYTSPVTTPTVRGDGDFERLFSEWTNKANHLIDELQKCSDDEKASRWGKFVDDAAKQRGLQQPKMHSSLFTTIGKKETHKSTAPHVNHTPIPKPIAAS